MMAIIQILVGMLVSAASFVLLYLMARSEIDFKDLTFAVYFGIFSTLGAIAFFVLTRKEDNEETNPGKEKVRR